MYPPLYAERCAPRVRRGIPRVEHRGVGVRGDRDRRGRVEALRRNGRRILRVLRSEEHTSELQSQSNLVCRLLLEKKKRLHGNKVATHYLTILIRQSERRDFWKLFRLNLLSSVLIHSPCARGLYISVRTV